VLIVFSLPQKTDVSGQYPEWDLNPHLHGSNLPIFLQHYH